MRRPATTLVTHPGDPTADDIGADTDALSAAVATRARSRRRRGWEASYASLLFALDLVLAVVAVVVALQVRYGGLEPVVTPQGPIAGLSFSVLVAAIAPTWVAFLLASRAYESKYLGVGSDEFKRVLSGTLRFAAALGLASYALHASVSRGFFAVLVSLGAVLLLSGRYAARKVLHALRRRGRCLHRVVAIGTADEVARLAGQLARDRYAGLEVVAACVPDASPGAEVTTEHGPLVTLGSVDGLAARMHEVGADTVAVAGTSALSSEDLRELSWQLEGTGVDLLLTPAITDVAGPRIHIRPVAGLSLLHVDEPSFGGVGALVKRTVDVLGAAMLLAVLAVPMIVIAVAVRLDSAGPVFYRQERVGRHGATFRMWKFRSMHVDADRRRGALVELDQSAGPLFKIRADPRVTRFGRFLRRRSIDELPQLFNVLLGQMSLVGPRPPLRDEVAGYEAAVHRRLYVRPGMTGLWQISGRTDLPWDESVRLDLYYVENWSLSLDALILWKTVFAVLRGHGAY
ncbi:MAG: sugar transferase [Frankiaceae bacterium]|nr:sugar transferase [Frankiaceae bacterium]